MNYISPLPSEEYCKDFAQNNKKRSLCICGSTGSIGVSTLKIAAAHKELFDIFALGAGKNIALLAEQVVEFLPKYIVIQDKVDKDKLKNILKEKFLQAKLDMAQMPEILAGQEGYEYIASHDEYSTFVSAQVGASGLRATLAAAQKGKVVCLANKESLVLAGSLLREICNKTKATILPIDSEHHALFQCLLGHKKEDVHKLILTASGGALRTKSLEFLQKAKASDALKHPNWSMGAKITIDSATLMNKGLEVIEACHLYGMDLYTIDVVVHPQSIIHSMVEYKDNSIIAQLSKPSMLLPIAHCLAYPLTLEGESFEMPRLDVKKMMDLTFEEVDNVKFPCLDLAKEAFRQKKCVALNAVNEIVVEAFLNDSIAFMQIPAIIEEILQSAAIDPNNINDILLFDAECRAKTREKLN